MSKNPKNPQKTSPGGTLLRTSGSNKTQMLRLPNSYQKTHGLLDNPSKS